MILRVPVAPTKGFNRGQRLQCAAETRMVGPQLLLVQIRSVPDQSIGLVKLASRTQRICKPVNDRYSNRMARVECLFDDREGCAKFFLSTGKIPAGSRHIRLAVKDVNVRGMIRRERFGDDVRRSIYISARVI